MFRGFIQAVSGEEEILGHQGDVESGMDPGQMGNYGEHNYANSCKNFKTQICEHPIIVYTFDTHDM